MTTGMERPPVAMLPRESIPRDPPAPAGAVRGGCRSGRPRSAPCRPRGRRRVASRRGRAPANRLGPRTGTVPPPAGRRRSPRPALPRPDSRAGRGRPRHGSPRRSPSDGRPPRGSDGRVPVPAREARTRRGPRPGSGEPRNEGESWVPESWPGGAVQTWVDRRPPTAMLVPCRLNATAEAAPGQSSGPSIRVPLSASQIQAFSESPVTILRPWTPSAAERMAPGCRNGLPTGFAEAMSHTRTTPSTPPIKTRRPLTLKAAAATAPSIPAAGVPLPVPSRDPAAARPHNS